MVQMGKTNLLDINQMYKQFSGNPVLNGVSITLAKGTVHAIVGGNGAGKSTLMKIITGFYRADSGTMKINGIPVTFSSTQDAHQHGIYLVPQEPLIFPNMTVEENIMIGLPQKKDHLREKIKKIIERLGWKFELHRDALSLSIAEQQLLEIIRGLVREAEILILDEPTSTLTFGEIDSLFKTIKQLTSDGVGVFYITHRFSEIFVLADYVSILRDGVISSHGDVSHYTYEKLIEGLVPNSHKQKENEISIQSTLSNHMIDYSKPPILDVQDLSGHHFSNISFSLHAGEILGIAGIVGAGRTELAEALIGLQRISKGSILLEGKNLNNLNIRQRINLGLTYVPEDRHSHGIFSITSIKNNISSTILHRLKGLFLPFLQEKQLAQDYVSKLNLKATSINQELQDLSGGNQQKVVLSKYLCATPKVFILDEPTRGIDANARKDIYQIIHDLKGNGLAVVLISSDMEEIEILSDRVIVMHEGSIIKELSKSEISVDAITSAAFGVKREVNV